MEIIHKWLNIYLEIEYSGEEFNKKIIWMQILFGHNIN